MIDKWFHTIELPLTIEQFHRLPQNRAYKYEYFDGKAWLSPRPKTRNALLELASFAPPLEAEPRNEFSIRPLREDDWERLPPLFSASFHRVQPFASLDKDESLQAARGCLEHTRSGGDGPLIEAACRVAELKADNRAVGGLLVTLAPGGDLSDFGACHWSTPPPADALQKRLGRPHLTWIFVGPWDAGHGIGTELLAASVDALIGLGYTELASTFLLGNESSTLWHWRMGFTLVQYPGSHRAIRESVRRRC